MRVLVVSIAILLCAGTKDALAQACGPAGPDPQGNCRDEPLPSIPITGPTGTEFISEPSGVEVKENGTVLGITPFRLSLAKLKPGAHVLEFHGPQYEPATRRVVVFAGNLQRVTQKMIPLPTINIEAADDESAGALVAIDQQPVGRVPLRNLAVAVGSHTIKAEKAGHDDWSTKLDFPSGSPPRDIKCILRPQFGTVTVGGAAGDLEGVAAWLDPESTEGKRSSSRVKGGTLLGPTPTKPVRIPSGKHIIALEVEGLQPISQVIMLGPDARVQVPAQVDFAESESQWGQAWNDSDHVNLKRAQTDCEQHITTGCLVAAYAAMHSSPPNSKDAETYYQKGCTQSSSAACFSLGYLERIRKAPEADTHLKAACLGGSINACLARHLPIEKVPNPTNNPAEWEGYADRPVSNSIGDPSDPVTVFGTLAGVVAVGTQAGNPMHFESMGNAGGRIFPHVQLRFGIGLRFRLIRQLDAMTAMKSYAFAGGPGFDIGFRIVPKTDSTFMVQAMVRVTAMLGAQSSLSGLATIGYAHSRRGVQLGVLVDKVPLAVQHVQAFGQDRTIEDYSWQVLVVASYGFDGELK